MLSRRHPHGSWAYRDWHQDERPSMFRILATHWRPVVPQLRQPESSGQADHGRERRKTLPSCWSPWLLIK